MHTYGVIILDGSQQTDTWITTDKTPVEIVNEIRKEYDS
jgi:hypothetical protein